MFGMQPMGGPGYGPGTFGGGYYPPATQNQFTPMQSQPFGQMNPLPQAQQPGTGDAGASIVWVPNEATAANYPVTRGSSVVLWVEDAPVIYLKTADASGRPATQVFELVERQAAPRPAPAQQAAPDYDFRSKIEDLSGRVDDLTARVESMTSRRTGKKDQEKEASDNG